MQCRWCLKIVDNLIVAAPTEAERIELVRHVRECPDCARQYSLAKETLAAITPSARLRASADFKERIMHAISSAQVVRPKPIAVHVSKARAIKLAAFAAAPVKLAAIVATAVALLVILAPLLRWGFQQFDKKGLSAFSLLAEASAAENKLFSGSEIVHLINEIVVTPLADRELAKMRWFPLCSMDATGKPRFSQLTLPAEVNQGYTVEDNSWYDPATGRFVRILTKDGKPIFANSFDGANVYNLETPATGTPRVEKRPIAKDFQAPRSPAEFLGIAAGLQSGMDVKDKSLVSDAGEVTLEDGAKCRVVKTVLAQGGPKELENNYFLFTIREDNNTIKKMEWLIDGRSLMIIRRGKSETGKEPKPGWDLAAIELQPAGTNAQAVPVISPDMVIPDVSVENMVKKADFPIYIFTKDPAWAGDRQIADILDLVSLPHRMFAITYKAKDHRHVVLVQSPGYTMLGPNIKTPGKVVYTSPSGIKVWDIKEKSAWLVKLMLQSARAAIKDPPVQEPTGYVLETPEGTFPALAVNGKITEEELHALIDSLVPAKK
jgi:hypothetical protein